MIFTDKFVYVHEPKTGGTFVTSVLFRLYGLRWTRWTHLRNALLGEVRARGKYGALVHNSNKHGGCREIPAAQRAKPVLATVRNPFDLYVSQYEFGWWKRPEFLKHFRAVPGFERDYPRFPELTFAEYVELAERAFGHFGDGQSDDGAQGGDRRRDGDERSDNGRGLGLRTREFVNFYFREPEKALRALASGDSSYVTSGQCREDMFDLHFVRTDQLNRGLHDFLLRMGYAGEDISFILEEGKILPRGRGRTAAQKWERYYTPELKQTIRRREWPLFLLFPEFDV